MIISQLRGAVASTEATLGWFDSTHKFRCCPWTTVPEAPVEHTMCYVDHSQFSQSFGILLCLAEVSNDEISSRLEDTHCLIDRLDPTCRLLDVMDCQT